MPQINKPQVCTHCCQGFIDRGHADPGPMCRRCIAGKRMAYLCHILALPERIEVSSAHYDGHVFEMRIVNIPDSATCA